MSVTDSITDKHSATSAAFFDVDGTLAKSNIVHYYIYLREQQLPMGIRQCWKAWFLLKCVSYLALDYIDRSKLNIIFYHNYRGLKADEIKAQAKRCHEHVIEPRLFAQALPCVESHRQAGRLIVFVTGSVDFLMAPLADSFQVSHAIAPALVERDGRFTGELNGPPIGQEEKAKRMSEYAQANHVDLATSYAYADSIADLAMLEMVGFPQAVNPDRRLAAIAKSRGWPIHQWTISPTTTAVSA